MKPFQTLLLLAVLILIGGMAAIYWGKTVEDATAPVEAVQTIEVVEAVEEEIAPGAYLVFQANEWDFYRLAVEDIADSQPRKFATLKNPLAVSGGLTPYVYGQHLLLHRYLQDEQDGIVSLKGEVLQTRPMQWGTIRSANGRYEVVWKSVYDEVETDIVVTDLVSGEVVVSIPESVFADAGAFALEPFLINDQGTSLYVHEVCACEATVAGVWRVNLETLQATRLDTLVNLDSWFLSSLDAQGGRFLSISTEREPAEDGPYDELLPPSTIRMLDLETLEATDLLVDEARAWDVPWLDPEGNDRYVVRLWDKGNRLYLVDFEDKAITEEDYLTDGWVLDWVGDWLVVMNTDDSSLKLVNTQTREEVEIELPDEYAGYIGSIELN
ncbi:hypothetical protein HY630_02725 [Candidatus Uhrbacteria bacterium]|nr:hypothetical protein [Candidatus Uhrbacteria bacterium]